MLLQTLKQSKMGKKVIYIDMDGVLVDLETSFEMFFKRNPHLRERYKDNPDHIQGVFRDAPPKEGAISAVNRLNQSGRYDLFIATSAPWGNPQSATEKRFWVEQYFGKTFHKKMFITHRKDLLMGDYLIDDRLKNGAGEFKGELIHFGWNYEEKKYNHYPSWASVLDYLL